ncbi:polysaccharide deacetylase family protein [Nocardioides sp.]|uniref:polysaccharide deacetylase family protein n=1 Tax=Nocardioides sp. TaxID=35761 RepID=UPI0031FE5B8A|nr:polysaccharide deacetylase [Nocardioides sp.]
MAPVRGLRVVVPVLGVLLALLVSTSASFGAKPHHRDPKPVTPCSRGLVALTFDDGPSATVTPRLVRTLERLDVPATFFMVGRRIAAAPDVARLVQRAGFTIGNHTWNHTDMTTQTADEVELALRLARRAMLNAGVTPNKLMRPPYGALDDESRRAVERAGYVPVFWTVDSRDWTGLRPQEIESRVLAAVRRHATNIVLQHDGVTNSPASVRAVTGEVTTLRRRGFCFAALDESGQPTPPVPTATVTHVTRRVVEGQRAQITVRLDEPTSRPTSVGVVTRHVTSSAGDFGWTSKRVRFSVGERVATLSLPVWRDGLDEAHEEVRIGLTHGRGVLSSPHDSDTVTLVDQDSPPEVTVTGATVTSSNVIAVGAPVTVRLSQPSGRDVSVRIRTHRESAGPDDYLPLDAWMTVPAGELTAVVPVLVSPGPVDERVETVRVDVLAVRHAELAGPGAARLTIHPAAMRVAPRLTLPGPDWS